MKKLSILLILVLLAMQAGAQTIVNDPKVLGDKAFKNKNYYEAAYYYRQSANGLNLIKQPVELPYHASAVIQKKGTAADRGYVSFMLAESYRLYENYLEAESWYYNVLNENLESKYPLARYYYAVCLRANQRFDECTKQMQQFIAGYKGDKQYIDMAKKEIATCAFAKEQYLYPELINVAKMKGTWNSDGSDYAMIKRDNNFMFTSSRMIKDDKKHLNRVYMASAATAFKPEMVMFKGDEKKPELEYGTPSLDPTGKRMFFTRWYKEGSVLVHNIYKSDYRNGDWSTPVKLNTNVNVDGFSSIQPFVTPDGKRMFFSSNKPGGQGGDDIWVSDLDDEGNPTNSINLGSNVNSELDEEAPFFDAGEERLIYSSKGFLGLGGFDFFETYFNGESWSKSVNMGYPMNSAKDDLYYCPDGADPRKFYISSDRESDCCLDLFEVHDQRHMLSGLVIDCDNQKALAGVKVSFVDSISKQTIKSFTVGRNGKYAFNVATKRPYNLVLEKHDYFTKVVPVSNDGKMKVDTMLNPDICLQPFVVNKPVVLKNILYDFDKATLRPESKVELNKLLTILKDNPKMKIELSSHTDSIGTDVYNQNLSQERAQSCVDYITANGISQDRIFAKGYGKSKPVAPNSTPNGQDNPDGRQLNRRTEFTVLKVDD